MSPLAANVTHLVFVGAVYLQMIGAPTCITLLWVGAFFCYMPWGAAIVTCFSTAPRGAVALRLQVSPLATNVAHLVFVGAFYLQMVGAATRITLLWVRALFCDMTQLTAIVTPFLVPIPGRTEALRFHVSGLAAYLTLLVLVGAFDFQMVSATACVTLFWAGTSFRYVAHDTAIVTLLDAGVRA